MNREASSGLEKFFVYEIGYYVRSEIQFVKFRADDDDETRGTPALVVHGWTLVRDGKLQQREISSPVDDANDAEECGWLQQTGSCPTTRDDAIVMPRAN